MNYYVYILSNNTHTAIYTGITNDLVRRVYEHKHCFDPQSHTARYHIHRLVYYEVAGNAEVAIAREKQIKGWNRKRKNKYIESMNPQWEDLYESILG